MQAFAPRTAAALGVAGSGSLEGGPPTPPLFLGLPAVELFSAPACGGLTSLSPPSLSLSTLTETRGVGEATAGWLERREARGASKLMATRPGRRRRGG
jgi:hypothetical protein